MLHNLPGATMLVILVSLSSCSALPEDIRATLPESMRGDVRALTDYPTPQLEGTWKDKDFPELSISMSQDANAFSFTRDGSHRGIAVDARFQGTTEGRSLKMTSSAKYSGQVRPVMGKCFGVVAKDSQSIQLTCEDGIKGTYPLNLVKS